MNAPHNAAHRSDTASSKIRRGIAYLQYLPRTFGLMWQVAPVGVGVWFSLLVLQGLLPVGIVLLTRQIVDGMVAAVSGDGGSLLDLDRVLWPAGLMGGVLLLMELTAGISRWIRAYNGGLIQDAITARIQEKSTTVDMAFYDSPAYFDHLHRARAEASFRPAQVMENTGTLVQNGVTLLSMGTVLIPYGLWIPAVLLLSTLPAFLVVFKNAVEAHQWRAKTTADDRRCFYYEYMLTERETAAEIRLFGLATYFRQRWKNLQSRLRKEKLFLIRKQNVGRILAGLVALVALAACVGWMGWRAIHKEMTLGELALFYAAFSKGQQMLRGLLSGMGEIYQDLLFLGDLYAFFGLESQIEKGERSVGDAAVPSIEKHIVFRDVGFRYPGSEHAVFTRFNLEIPVGRTVALVGPNGSGKSTLVRLLCRFYDPDRGQILIDERDVKNIPVNDLRKAVSVLFQQPVQYSATAKENVALGDIEQEENTKAILQSIVDSGADGFVDGMPQKGDTLLGKWFEGGSDLSVGQWQRLALARAFFRQAPIILLDEPTSAMDSWAEDQFMTRLKKLVKGRTTLLITHRFTTAMQADYIHVLDQGEIVESGTHKELIQLGGYYASSWKRQVNQNG